MQCVLPQWRSVLGHVAFGLPFGLDIDRGAVVRRADCAFEEGFVVACVVPVDPGLVVRILPQADRELDRLDRRLVVQHHRLAVALDFLAAPGPEIGIPKGGSPQVWPRDWPNGRPLALSFLPASRYSSKVCGNLPSP